MKSEVAKRLADPEDDNRRRKKVSADRVVNRRCVVREIAVVRAYRIHRPPESRSSIRGVPAGKSREVTSERR